MNLLALPILRAITGRVWVYIALAACAGSFFGGYWVKSKFEQAKQLAAVNDARAKERDAARIGNVTESKYLNDLAEMENIGHENVLALQKRLASVPRCDVPVPAEFLRNEPVPRASRDTARAESAAASVASAPIADARDVVLTCERNRVEVAQPNALQLRALQAWYEDLRKRFNK